MPQPVSLPEGAAQPDFFQNLTLKDREAEPRRGRGPKRVSRNQSRDSLRPSSAPKKKGTAAAPRSGPCTECFFGFVFIYVFLVVLFYYFF